MSGINSNAIEIIYHQPGHLKGVTVIQAIDGKIFTGGGEGRICIWDEKIEKEIACIYAHKTAITDIQRISDTNYFVTTSQNLEIKLWSLKTLELLQSKRAHSSTIIGAKPWSNYIISASRDQFLKKWKLEDNKLIEVDKVKIPDLERFFIADDIIITAHHDGLISIYRAEDLGFVKYLSIKPSAIIKAIKRASKDIIEFQGKDPRYILQQFARLNGFPVTICKDTEESIILGHVAGMITIWDKQKHKNTEIIFPHGKNITGVEIKNNIIYSSSMSSHLKKSDFSSKRLIIHTKIEHRPLSLSLLPSKKVIVGLESGEIHLYDESLNLVKKKNNIVPVSSLCIMPRNVAVASRDGEITVLDINNLKQQNTKKLYEKSIQGIFYYENRLICIGDNSIIHILDSDMNVLKTIKLSEKPTKLHQVKRYIILTPNLVLDLQKDEIIKGEISKETENEVTETSLFQIDFSHGDSSIFIHHNKLETIDYSDRDSYYPVEIIKALRVLVDSQNKMQYTRINSDTVSSHM
ncbi:MAG: hypothetical protein KAS52_00060 [Candidatus Heimdallarchaeota archaeon]|nr:hypothetical protein [Candidatus Heimdallarchaeota archaeon]